MTQEIFEKWFHNEFVPKVRAYLQSIHQEEKAILLIDNCPAHSMKLESSDKKIKCLFLPPESMSLIMPMNQGPIAYLKRKYRTSLLRNAVLEPDFLKTFNIKGAIYSLANLWQEMPENMLRTCWHKLKTNLNVSYTFESIDMAEIRANFNKLGLNLSDLEINCWLDVDFDDPGYGFLTDQEMIDLVKNPSANTSLEVPNESLDCSTTTNSKIINANQAYSHCTELMLWLEAQADAKPEDLIFMQKIKELASSHRFNDMTHLAENSLITTAESLSLSFLAEKLIQNRVIEKQESIIAEDIPN